MAQRGAKVVMACRDLFKCETTRQEIVLETRNKYVYCRSCDLSVQKSIHEFVRNFKKEHGRLDILINNAGVMRCPKTLTADGIEMQLGVNHIGHFLLTNLLLDTIKASAPARIVNVSSVAHTRGSINTHDLNSTNSYDAGEAYAQSKLANILFTKELAKKLKDTGVTVNAVHPGIVDTELMRHMSFSKSVLANFFIKPLFWVFLKTPKQGAQTVIFTALDPSLNDVTGAYFSNLQRAEESENAKDEKMASWLWQTSAKWTKLNLS
ncbi:retinol dehydrogenase 13 isoform X3 [Fopius arisanus]|nr:PREDICTED: retinol dehydrogenase 13-like isoform X3 [Fopius arisanus]XP_011305180.1 PREDICTED: retinol dehydrogenase 13-like isoform X3 [Fopius arisanus]XP_011305181.1 PREDICTED: retinol dehydrogenase 13-like isoform X3 [Fopius arisanus]